MHTVTLLLGLAVLPLAVVADLAVREGGLAEAVLHAVLPLADVLVAVRGGVGAFVSACALTATMYPSISAKRRPSGTPATSSRHAFDFAHAENFSTVPARMMQPSFVRLT